MDEATTKPLDAGNDIVNDNGCDMLPFKSPTATQIDKAVERTKKIILLHQI